MRRGPGPPLPGAARERAGPTRRGPPRYPDPTRRPGGADAGVLRTTGAQVRSAPIVTAASPLCAGPRPAARSRAYTSNGTVLG